MVQGRRIAAVLAITVVATIAEAASAPALSVPGVTTPTVTTPTVTVPPVSTPVVTTPSVSVPSATAPKATTPSVSTPSGGGAPKVSPPKVSPPQASAPTVTTPKRTSTSPAPKNVVPSIGNGGGGGGGGGGAVSGIVNGVRTTIPSGSSGGLGGGPSGTAGGGYSVPGSGSQAVAPILGGTPGGPGGGGFAGPGGYTGFAGPGGFGGGPGAAVFALGIPRVASGSGGVTAFAAAVGALAGCFYALSPFEQQVLTVRTGIDGRQALTRPEVAAVLGTTPSAIGQTERGALGQLRAAAGTDGCMPVGSGAPANALTAFIGGPFGPVGFVTPGVPPVSRSEPGSGGVSLASTSFAERLASLPDGTDQASLSVLVIIAVMLSGALAALLLEARSQVH
jgi:hypothetical protein